MARAVSLFLLKVTGQRKEAANRKEIRAGKGWGIQGRLPPIFPGKKGSTSNVSHVARGEDDERDLTGIRAGRSRHPAALAGEADELEGGGPLHEGGGGDRTCLRGRQGSFSTLNGLLQFPQ